MPIVNNTTPTSIPDFIPDPKPEEPQESQPLLGAAIRQENSMYAAYELLTRPKFQDTPGYDLRADLTKAEIPTEFWKSFIGVRSEKEFAFVQRKLEQELRDRRRVASAGIGGIVAGIAMGTLDPTLFIPLTAGGKGAKALGQAIALGAGGAVAQEGLLLGEQQTRTTEEAAIGVTTATIISGILGGAVAYMTRKGFADASADMAGAPDTGAIRGEGAEALAAVQRVQGRVPWHVGRSSAEVAAEVERRAQENGFGTIGYHGSTERIVRFNRKRTDSGMDAIFFADDPGLASRFALREEGGLGLDPGLGNPAFMRVLEETLSPELFQKVRTLREDTEKLFDWLDEYRSKPDVDLNNPEYVRKSTAVSRRLDALERILEEANVQGFYNPKGRFDIDAEDPFVLTGRPNISKVRLRLGDVHEVDMGGDFDVDAEQAALDAARAAGKDTLVIKNWGGEGNIYAVLRNENIRNFFDPLDDLAPQKPYEPEEIVALPAGGTVPADAGAASNLPRSAGGLAPSLGMARLMDLPGISNAVLRTLRQNVSQVARLMMGQMADGGMRLEGNEFFIPTAKGGTSENRIGTYQTFEGNAILKLEDLYANYMLGKDDIGLLRNARARIGGLVGKDDKLDPVEFRQAVTNALEEPDEATIPEVREAAEFIRKNFYDIFQQRAIEAGLMEPDEFEEVLGATGYANTIYNKKEIVKDRAAWTQLISTHLKKQLEIEWQERLEKLQERIRRQELRADDLMRPWDEVEELLEEFMEESIALRESDDYVTLSTLRDMKAELKELREGRKPGAPETDEEKALKFQIEAVEHQHKDALKAVRAEDAEIRRRTAALNRGYVATSRRQYRKMLQIEKLEELNLNKLAALTKHGQRLLNKIDRNSDEAFEIEFDKYLQRFEKQAALYSKTEDRINRMVEEGVFTDAELARLLRAEDQNSDRLVRLDGLRRKLEELEGIDPEQVRQGIQDTLDALAEKANTINSKRAVRQQKLREQAKKLDPKRVEEEAKNWRNRNRELRLDFSEKIREAGAEDFDFETGTMDFTAKALEETNLFTERLLGGGRRLHGLDIINDARGPTLKRVLQIDRRLTRKYRDLNIETLINAYTRHMAPDIELTRKFGSPNAEEWFARLYEEKAINLQKIEAKDLPEDKKRAEREKLEKKYSQIDQDLKVVLNRQRRTRGIAQEPDHIMTRLGVVARDINTARFMGTVLPSSVADVARPVMKYGLLNTFRDGWLPFIQNLKEVKLARQYLRDAGVGYDVVLHQRTQAIFDIDNDHVRKTRIERGTQFLANKVGQVALFDRWTTEMKFIAASVANAHAMRQLRIVMTGKGNVRRAQAFLAEAGIDGELAGKIWKEVQSGDGATLTKDALLPNTEAWTDTEAKRAYQALLYKHSVDSIVTPGADRPNWVDANEWGKLLAQFRSFGFASSGRILIANAQGLSRGEVNAVTGMMTAIAMGAISYYIYAITAGGQIEENMRNASPEAWVDEAFDRSGLLGAFAEWRRVGERIPLVNETALGRLSMLKLSSERSSRRQGAGLLDAMLGPTWDLAGDVANVVAGIDEPTQSTLHSARQMMFYQNVFYLRRAFDHIEQAVAGAWGLPEKRE